ncbi:DUF3231 family protein [Bacillus sp. JJ1533]|uniref:DUF3231 family protein n=1 Tax=Bacillus sp. JJ1533 TaxID=3122959 RepID=UPI0030002E46
MEDKTKIPLTAAEISGLWAQYINDTVATCVNRYFLEKVEDEEVRPVIEWTLDTAKENLSIMEELFKKENYPIPIGFAENDVNLDAPKLVSDSFMLVYLRHMSIIAMTAGGSSLGIVTRPDLVSFFKRISEKGIMLQDLTRELMLKQGTYVRPPSLSKPDKVEFVKDQGFLAGFFGDKRALTAIEITQLFINLESNAIGKALITGFAQTAQDEEVKQYFSRGKKLAEKNSDIFTQFLKKEDLPTPMSWSSAISNTTTNVFFDKLMMYHILTMASVSIGYYGTAMGTSQRRDLGLRYASMLPEVLLYAEDGANIMIKHGWLEKPPQADNRDQLINE